MSPVTTSNYPPGQEPAGGKPKEDPMPVVAVYKTTGGKAEQPTVAEILNSPYQRRERLFIGSKRKPPEQWKRPPGMRNEWVICRRCIVCNESLDDHLLPDMQAMGAQSLWHCQTKPLRWFIVQNVLCKWKCWEPCHHLSRWLHLWLQWTKLEICLICNMITRY